MDKAIIQVTWLQDGQCHVIVKQLGEVDWVNHKINYIELENSVMSRQQWFSYKGEITALMADAGFVVSVVEKAESTG